MVDNKLEIPAKHQDRAFMAQTVCIMWVAGRKATHGSKEKQAVARN